MINKKMMYCLALLAITIFCSCSQDENTFETNKSETRAIIVSPNEEKEAEELAVSVDELKKMSSEVKSERAANLILSKFLTFCNNQYSLNITKEEALSKGVSSDLYEKAVADLKKSNELILKAIKDGSKIDLSNTEIRNKK